MSDKQWILALAALTALVLALGAACGGDGDEDGEAGAPATETQTDAGDNEPMSVGLISDVGGVDDGGFNEFSINGLERAEAELGVDGRVYISRSGDDYLPNLTSAAEDGHDLVIVVGFKLAPATVEVAQEFPDVHFAGIDSFYGQPPECNETKTCMQPNTYGMVYPTEEAGYLAAP